MVVSPTGHLLRFIHDTQSLPSNLTSFPDSCLLCSWLVRERIMLLSKHSATPDKAGLSCDSELLKYVAEEPAEKRMRTENLGKNDPGIFSADASSVDCMDDETPTISKRQLKKLRKKEKWLAYRPIKR